MNSSGWTLAADPDPWKIAAAAALVIYSIWSYRRTIPPVTKARRALLAALRVAGFSLLVFFALDPSIVKKAESVRPPVVPVLVDVSASMGARDSDGRTRLETARLAAEEVSASLDDARVEIIPFSSGLAGASVDPDSLPGATGEGTDIYGSISEAERRYADDNLAGIVVVSDGRITRGMKGGELPGRAPVYTIVSGDTLEEVDLSVERVGYEREVYAGTREKVGAVIRFSSAAGDRAAVEMIEGGRVLDRSVTGVLQGDGLVEVDLRYVPSVEGIHQMEIRVEPAEDEINRGNNSELFRVNVVKDRVAVLFFDGSPDWNMTFIRRICEGSRRLELETAVPSRGGGFRSASGAVWAMPASAGELSRYDLVIAGGDLRLSPDQAGALQEYVMSGGALLLIGSELSPLVSREAPGILMQVLPVSRLTAPMIVTGEYSLIPGPAGAAAWLPDITSDPGRLPPLSAGISGLSPDPGAVVPLEMESGDSRLPFLVVERKGDGMSAVLLGFPVWRWNLAGDEGAEAYRGLFGGLIQYLAEGRNAPAIDVQTDRTVYRTGERIEIRIYPSTERAATDLRGEIVPAGADDVPAETFIPVPEAGRPGAWSAFSGGLPPGEYSVRVASVEEGEQAASGEASFTVQPLSVEMLRTSADASQMARLAAVSGGKVIDPSDPGSVAGLLDRSGDTSVTTSIRKIRGKLWLFLAIVLVFSAEWLLRKLFGLV